MPDRIDEIDLALTGLDLADVQMLHAALVMYSDSLARNARALRSEALAALKDKADLLALRLGMAAIRKTTFRLEPIATEARP